MRNLWYAILFLLPTALVVTGFIYRKPLRVYLEEQGVLTPAKDAQPQAKTPPPKAGASIPADSASRGPVAAKSTAKPSPSVDPIEGKYPMPKIKTLEEIVGNWSNVPKGAFPAWVEVKKPVAMEIVINDRVAGSSKLPDGSKVHPVELNGTTLTVSSAEDGTGPVGKIGIDDTDFKTQVRARYDKWRNAEIAKVEKLRKAERARADKPQEEAPASADDGSDQGLGPRPVVEKDGRIPILEGSVKSGQVKEIKLDKIRYWRLTGRETVAGVDYWTAVVGYVAHTVFGEINAEGKALIRGGRVEKWIYSGSEEPIH